MDYQRISRPCLPCTERIGNYDDFHIRLAPEDRRNQGGRCMNCGVPFCQSVYGCPLHNLIPEWNDEIWNGSMIQALSRLLKTNNFPEFTGRVCPALCENACICGMDDPAEAVTIRENELAIIEYAWENGLMEPQVPCVRTGKKAAIVGSGPAGLAAAEQLNRRGHTVTVYERNNRPGGLLTYGIPNMKLDKKIVARRIEKMAAEGVQFVTGVNVGVYIPGSRLLEENDAVILCCGAGKPRSIEAKGLEAGGVFQALDYLTESTKSLLDGRSSIYTAKGKDVVIVGNGDTATDCVATALRQGAKSVTQLVRKPNPGSAPRIWPYRSTSLKTDYGQEEAAAAFGKDPRMFRSKAKELIADEKGNLKEILVTCGEEEITIPAQMLLIAAGFSGAEEKTAEAFGLSLNEKGRIGGEGHRTSNPKIFTAGDARLGATLVVTAIAEGRAAAKEVDEFLEGYTNL